MSSYTDDWWEGYIDCLTDAGQMAKTYGDITFHIVKKVLLESLNKRQQKAWKDIGGVIGEEQYDESVYE